MGAGLTRLQQQIPIPVSRLYAHINGNLSWGYRTKKIKETYGAYSVAALSFSDVTIAPGRTLDSAVMTMQAKK
jgi:hypothetical protein